jgi:hypothetical protein
VLEYYGMLGFGVEPIRMEILNVYIEIQISKDKPSET